MIQLSNSESRTLCKRVFTALDYPAGADSELADAIVWLAATGVYPLSRWAQWLSHLQLESEPADSDHSSSQFKSTLTITREFDLTSLLQASDALVGSCIQNESESELKYSEPKFWHLLLPLILKRSQFKFIFQLTSPPLRCVVLNGELWSNYQLANLKDWQETECCKVRCRGLHSDEVQSMFDRTGLEHHFSCESIRTLSSQRIEIDLRSFKVLKQKAAESFVPNSELSRSSGAGAEVDDSD